tara:strand:- start:9675 stop:9920 length:246 start_codon:yes stop_codon:yes gene_type:complete
MKRIGLIGLGEMGIGQLASSYEPTAKALKKDGYEGVISLESVYCPEGCTFEDGFVPRLVCLNGYSANSNVPGTYSNKFFFG